MSVVTGIDPGASGAIAHIAAGVLEVIPMPWLPNAGIDVAAVKTFLACSNHVFIEDLQDRPENSRNALKASAIQYGKLLGVIETLGIPMSPPVNPRTWQKEMGCVLPSNPPPQLKDYPKSEHARIKKERARLAAIRRRAKKLNAIAVARRLWPREQFLPTPRCKVPSDGMAEAALICEYGRRKLAGMTNRENDKREKGLSS